MNNVLPIDSALKRDRAIVIGGLAAITAVSWAYLFYDAAHMAHMGKCICMPTTTSWSAQNLFLLFVMWAVMMIGMMTPSVAPMVLMFAQVNRSRREREEPFVSTGIFLLGYLVAWTGFSLIATVAQWALHTTALLSPQMVSASPLLGGTILLAAGIFQITPLKNACLTHCRSPLSFLMTDWREGTGGALIMGLRHGVFCVGCCWLLMALLFVAGVMNLLWVAIITVFVLLEKILPAGKWVSRVSGIALLIWAIWVFCTALPI